MDLDEILLTADDTMQKTVDYLKSELRGVRTGRASPALVEYIKVDYYGSQTDLRSLALITVPEPTQIVVKPFDASSMGEVKKAIETSGLGLNPMAEGKQLRLSIPALSGERRQQMLASVKQMGEQAKVALRNVRRDSNKHIDQLGKDKTQHLSEDQVEAGKNDIQEMLKTYEKQVDDQVAHKAKEIQEV
jgi:ribosome recycling factor